jgi:hypothetical protein
MASENGVLVGVGEIRKVVESADVFTVAFTHFPQRLLVDTRFDDDLPPLVQLVKPVASAQERFFWLGTKRPSLGMPKAFMYFAWPHSVSFLKESGIWERIRERVGAPYSPEVDRQSLKTLARLQALEQRVTAAAITGDHHATLWQR